MKTSEYIAKIPVAKYLVRSITIRAFSEFDFLLKSLSSIKLNLNLSNTPVESLFLMSAYTVPSLAEIVSYFGIEEFYYSLIGR